MSNKLVIDNFERNVKEQSEKFITNTSMNLIGKCLNKCEIGNFDNSELTSFEENCAKKCIYEAMENLGIQNLK